jgi:hypothetical protein
MMMTDLYDELKERTLELLDGKDLLTERVRIKARPLRVEEAIGNPEEDDFPLQKGVEKLMQAEFMNAVGQAYTDQYGDYEGTLEEVFQMALKNNYRRAILVATSNAVLRYLHRIDRTIHCHDQEPNKCAQELVRYLKERHGRLKIAQVGFQPRMVEYLAPEFPLRVLDMDPDNIGSKKFNITIEDPENTEDAVSWADLLLVTGTTLVNDTIEHFVGKKPVLFYGTTIAGAAHLMGWEQFCACAK